MRSAAPPPNAFAPVYVPLLNIPYSGLRLRPEFRAVCEYASIPFSDLITLDDLPLAQKPLENVRWTLVDHNTLQGHLGEIYFSQIHGVIDHHEEENAVPQETDPEPRIIEKCGSCTSLVVRYCKSMWDSISGSSLSLSEAHGQGDLAVNDETISRVRDAQIAKVALASILIDTADLTAPGKVQDVDSDAVRYLEARIQSCPKTGKNWSRKTFYEEIDQAKRNIDDLSLNEVLSKDFKQWTENGLYLGISSSVEDLATLAKKAGAGSDRIGFAKALDVFMQERALAIFAVMTTSKSQDGEFRRELLIQANEHAHSSLKTFVEEAGPVLQLEDIEIAEIPTQRGPPPGSIWRQSWVQRDVRQSRKQVAPMLRKAIR